MSAEELYPAQRKADRILQLSCPDIDRETRANVAYLVSQRQRTIDEAIAYLSAMEEKAKQGNNAAPSSQVHPSPPTAPPPEAARTPIRPAASPTTATGTPAAAVKSPQAPSSGPQAAKKSATASPERRAAPPPAAASKGNTRNPMPSHSSEDDEDAGDDRGNAKAPPPAPVPKATHKVVPKVTPRPAPRAGSPSGAKPAPKAAEPAPAPAAAKPAPKAAEPAPAAAPAAAAKPAPKAAEPAPAAAAAAKPAPKAAEPAPAAAAAAKPAPKAAEPAAAPAAAAKPAPKAASPPRETPKPEPTPEPAAKPTPKPESSAPAPKASAVSPTTSVPAALPSKPVSEASRSANRSLDAAKLELVHYYYGDNAANYDEEVLSAPGQVILFTTSMTGERRVKDQCRQLDVLLSVKQIPHHVMDIADNAFLKRKARQIYKAGTGETMMPNMPLLCVDNRLVGDFDTVQDLEDCGELDRKLAAMGVSQEYLFRAKPDYFDPSKKEANFIIMTPTTTKAPEALPGEEEPAAATESSPDSPAPEPKKLSAAAAAAAAAAAEAKKRLEELEAAKRAREEQAAERAALESRRKAEEAQRKEAEEQAKAEREAKRREAMTSTSETVTPSTTQGSTDPSTAGANNGLRFDPTAARRVSLTATQDNAAATPAGSSSSDEQQQQRRLANSAAQRAPVSGATPTPVQAQMPAPAAEVAEEEQDFAPSSKTTESRTPMYTRETHERYRDLPMWRQALFKESNFVEIEEHFLDEEDVHAAGAHVDHNRESPANAISVSGTTPSKHSQSITKSAQAVLANANRVDGNERSGGTGDTPSLGNSKRKKPSKPPSLSNSVKAR